MGIRALGHRNYRLFFTGQVISLVGSWMQSTAQAWLVYRMTGSEVLLGLVGFADKVPVFVLGLVGGLVADRFDRHRVVVITQSASMVQALVLGVLVVSGHATVPAVLALAAVQGVINAFDLPARQAFISTMVQMDDLPNALALNSSVFNAARVIGPAVAGVLVATVGEGPCFLLNAISYVAVLVCLLAMRFTDRPVPARGPSMAAHLREGLGYAWSFGPVRALLVLLGIMALCGMPYSVLMPVFAGEILGGGPRGLGTLMGATGAGAFLAAVVLARRKSVAGLGRVVAAAAVAFGASLILFASSRSFVLSAAVLTLTGFSMITQASSTNLLLQALCPDALRGRVMSLYTIMFVGMAPWGSLIAGALAHAIGTPATVAAGGGACALAGLLFATRLPALRPLVRHAIPESPVPPEWGRSRKRDDLV
ncbi:MAG: MFS transporter [Candidatus Polarisedimenticolia bacterium]